MNKPQLLTLLFAGTLSAVTLFTPDIASAQKSKDTLRIGLREQVGLMSLIYNARPETGLFEREVVDALLSYNPQTKKYEEGHGWTFHTHEFIGGKMVPGIFRKLKLPLNEKYLATFFIDFFIIKYLWIIYLAWNCRYGLEQPV